MFKFSYLENTETQNAHILIDYKILNKRLQSYHAIKSEKAYPNLQIYGIFFFLSQFEFFRLMNSQIYE